MMEDSIADFLRRIIKIRKIPGSAMNSPVWVVIKASEMPAATMSTVSDPLPEEMAENVPSIPMTVPKRPIKGAEATSVLRKINFLSTL